MVGQKAHVGAMTLADLDDATATIQISSPEIVTDSSTVTTTNHENRRPREAAPPAFPPAGREAEHVAHAFREPTADRYGCRKGIPPPVCGQLFFNSSASITRMPLGPRT